MSMILKAGARLYGAVCSTEIVVVKAPATSVEILIGGQAPLGSPADRSGDVSTTAAGDTALVLGKRYVDPDETVEVLCTKAGEGPVSVGGVVLVRKDAKPLPSSD